MISEFFVYKNIILIKSIKNHCFKLLINQKYTFFNAIKSIYLKIIIYI